MPQLAILFQSNDRPRRRFAPLRYALTGEPPSDLPRPARYQRRLVPRPLAESCCHKGFFSDRRRSVHFGGALHSRLRAIDLPPANRSLPARGLAVRRHRPSGWSERGLLIRQIASQFHIKGLAGRPSPKISGEGQPGHLVRIANAWYCGCNTVFLSVAEIIEILSKNRL